MVAEVEPMPVRRGDKDAQEGQKLDLAARLGPVHHPDQDVVLEPYLHLHVPASRRLRRTLHTLEVVDVDSAD